MYISLHDPILICTYYSNIKFTWPSVCVCVCVCVHVRPSDGVTLDIYRILYYIKLREGVDQRDQGEITRCARHPVLVQYTGRRRSSGAAHVCQSENTIIHLRNLYRRAFNHTIQTLAPRHHVRGSTIPGRQKWPRRERKELSWAIYTTNIIHTKLSTLNAANEG